jgi:hypothetical protein
LENDLKYHHHYNDLLLFQKEETTPGNAEEANRASMILVSESNIQSA